MKPYDIFKANNTLLNSVYCVTEYIICNLVLIHYTYSIELFQDKAKARLNQILSVEESPLAVAPAPGLLTPPPSSRKSISDHSVTLAGGLT
jgi:hypothetical protein